MPSFIEVFAGCGGLSSGLEKAGLTPLLLVDNDKNCVETLKANHTDERVQIQCISVKELHLDIYKDRVDVLAGGVPCQAFSQAGLRKGLEDDRGNLFFDYIRLVDECEPKVFIIENVVGLTTHNQGNTLTQILEQLQKTTTNSIEYKIQYKVLNALDYGVAQKRKRVVIVGVRTDIQNEYTFPEPLAHKPTLREALQDCPPSEGVKYPEKKIEVMRLVPPGGCWIDLPENVKKAYMGKSMDSGGGKRGIARRIAWDEPCLTLTTSPCQKQTERCHPEETRPFTIREYARIQSFPDSYIFKGSMNSKYRQIGNAVPVELGYHVGKSIVSVLNSNT
jgi:DNA (cytosine-5)-methyltransferase 1